jgi:hypothetical protein
MAKLSWAEYERRANDPHWQRFEDTRIAEQLFGRAPPGHPRRVIADQANRLAEIKIASARSAERRLVLRHPRLADMHARVLAHLETDDPSGALIFEELGGEQYQSYARQKALLANPTRLFEGQLQAMDPGRVSRRIRQEVLDRVRPEGACVGTGQCTCQSCRERVLAKQKVGIRYRIQTEALKYTREAPSLETATRPAPDRTRASETNSARLRSEALAYWREHGDRPVRR